MTDQHPITPPPDELVDQWRNDNLVPENLANYVATQAARWGGDQELEACCEWLMAQKWFNNSHIAVIKELRAARRPKPPSLKERALQAWAAVEAGTDDQTAMAVIRRALEALPE